MPEWMFAPLLAAAITTHSAQPPQAVVPPDPIQQVVESQKKPTYDEAVLQPFKKKRDAELAKVQAACNAQGGTTQAFECIPPPPPPPPEPVVPVDTAIAQPVAPNATLIATGTSGLLGSVGYALPSGNCVDTAKAYGKNQPGNPISWVPTTTVPFIGAAALFSFNHVGVVVGIWPNGDVEIAHQNCPGCPTRYPASSFRGFF